MRYKKVFLKRKQIFFFDFGNLVLEIWLVFIKYLNYLKMEPRPVQFLLLFRFIIQRNAH